MEYNLQIIAGVNVKEITGNFEEVHIDFLLETRKNSLYAWKDSENNRRQIWLNACKYTKKYRNKSLSLCLGLFSYKDALQGPFLNVTASDINSDDTEQFRKNLGKANSRSSSQSQINQIYPVTQEQDSDDARETENPATNQEDRETNDSSSLNEYLVKNPTNQRNDFPSQKQDSQGVKETENPATNQKDRKTNNSSKVENTNYNSRSQNKLNTILTQTVTSYQLPVTRRLVRGWTHPP